MVRGGGERFGDVALCRTVGEIFRQRVSVCDVAVYGGHLSAFAGTYDADHRYGHAVAFHELYLSLFGAVGNHRPAAVCVLIVIIGAGRHAVFYADEVVRTVILRHEVVTVRYGVEEFGGVFETEREEGVVVEGVFFVEYDDDFVIVLRPAGIFADQLVLTVEQGSVFQHFVPHREHIAELLNHIHIRTEQPRKTAEGGFDAFRERVDFEIGFGVVDVIAEDVEVHAVVVFDITHIAVEVFFDVGFQRGEVVGVVEHGGKMFEKSAYDLVYVNFVRVGPVLAVLVLLHKYADDGVQVGVGAVYLDGILRKHVLFHRGDVCLRAARKGKDEDDADDAYAARKRGENCASLFADEVGEAQRRRRADGHCGV